MAEADSALRNMLTFKKWPHFFHQSNLAKYDERGNTLLFDWLNAVFTKYERLLTLPVKNLSVLPDWRPDGRASPLQIRDCPGDMGSHDQQGDFESKQGCAQSHRYRS